jgi:murein DD-endopeptidase MepM/ murein hydrolase activator NlpD
MALGVSRAIITRMRFIVGFVVALLLIAGGVWIFAGTMSGPAIDIRQPAKVLGANGTLEVAIDAPKGALSGLEVAFEQQGKRTVVAALTGTEATLTQDGPDRIRVQRPLNRSSVPGLQSGPARIVVTAARPVVYGIRTIESSATRDVAVRLEPPRASVVSTHHYINLGGAEMVVYRVTPPDVASGVRVGDVEYRGFPASGAGALAGVKITDPALHVAFFALLHDQELNTPMHVFARDEAGNTARADFDHRVFPKPFRRSRIEVDDSFVGRVVPAILERTPDLKPDGDDIAKFLVINRDLRRQNAETIEKLASQTAAEALWTGPFQQLGNSKVESAFADHRTYFYKGREVDQQIHLGFDLAVTANVPIVAANRGRVAFADYLGIYGNCVILDHGLGVQTLYAHLSSFETAAGQTVEKGQTLGRSGMTGLAGGDHLHFTQLVQGRAVNPVEWWDAHWIEDRVLRKLRGL